MSQPWKKKEKKKKSRPGPPVSPLPSPLSVSLAARRTRRRRRPALPRAGHPRLPCHRFTPPLALILHDDAAASSFLLPANPSSTPHGRRPPQLRCRRRFATLGWPPSEFLAPGASPPSPRRIPVLTRPPPSPHRAAGESLGPPPPNAVAPPPRRRSPPSELPVRLTANASTPCTPSLPCSGLASPRRLAPRRRRHRRARCARARDAPRAT